MLTVSIVWHIPPQVNHPQECLLPSGVVVPVPVVVNHKVAASSVQDPVRGILVQHRGVAQVPGWGAAFQES